MYSTKQQFNLQRFLDSTDRISVYRQIKYMMKKAEKVLQDDLVRRRKKLQQILDEEDTMYKEGFAKRVRKRIDRDIERRQKILDEKKAQLALEKAELFQTIFIQQQRAEERQKLEEFRQNVRDTNYELFDRKMTELKNQMNDEEQLEIGRLEMKAIQKQMRDLQLETAQIINGTHPKQVAFANELAREMKDNREHREAGELQESKDHRELVPTIQCEGQEQMVSLEARKRAFHKSTLEYIQFVRRFRTMEESPEKVRDDRIANLRGLAICTKSNVLAEAKRRAENASRYYAELRRQITDHCECRMRKDAEDRQRAILENRFARELKSRAEISEELCKIRAELYVHIAEMADTCAKEEVEFEKHLRAAFDNPELCTQLAEKYLNEGTDYLSPHPNWRILACPKEDYVATTRVAFVPPKGRPEDSCMKPCGCDVNSPLAKECYIPLYVLPKLELAKRKHR